MFVCDVRFFRSNGKNRVPCVRSRLCAWRRRDWGEGEPGGPAPVAGMGTPPPGTAGTGSATRPILRRPRTLHRLELHPISPPSIAGPMSWLARTARVATRRDRHVMVVGVRPLVAPVRGPVDLPAAEMAGKIEGASLPAQRLGQVSVGVVVRAGVAAHRTSSRPSITKAGSSAVKRSRPHRRAAAPQGAHHEGASTQAPREVAKEHPGESERTSRRLGSKHEGPGVGEAGPAAGRHANGPLAHVRTGRR